MLFINNNLEEKLTLETLSSISNFSPFHFHRIMRAHLGESIGKYGDNRTADTWNKLMDYVKRNRLFSWRMELFGISHDDPNITETDKCRYDACVSVSKEIKPEGEIGFKEIEGGKYAIFRYKEPYTGFGCISSNEVGLNGTKN